MNIYKEKLMEHYRNPRNTVKLDYPDISSGVSNPSCGDSVCIDLIINNNFITRIAYEGKGCIISQAAGSLLTEYVLNKNIDNILDYDDKSILDIIGIELGPNRAKCALLSFEALRNAIQKYKLKFNVK